jgi:hypothetical protein
MGNAPPLFIFVSTIKYSENSEFKFHNKNNIEFIEAAFENKTPDVPVCIKITKNTQE